MMGLLMKDFRLIRNQMKFFAILFVFSAIMMFVNENASFIINYVTVLVSMFTITTISYDEYNHGYNFLFTMPVTKKQYVLEKYVLTALLTFISGILSITMLCGYEIYQGTGNLQELFWTSLASIIVIFLLISILIPLEFKFGAEKSRNMLFFIIGALWAVVYGLFKMIPNAKEMLKHLADKVSAMSNVTVISGIALLGVIIVGVSFTLSIRIMNQKEF